jgi:hypothetical protein
MWYCTGNKPVRIDFTSRNHFCKEFALRTAAAFHKKLRLRAMETMCYHRLGKKEGEYEMNAKKIRTVLAVMLVLILCLVPLTACGAALSGSWQAEEGTAPYGFPDEVEFFSNGTCAVDGMSGEYTCEKGRVNISVMGGAYTYDYSMSGGSLTLSNDADTANYIKN